jgi:hypothetical protein
VLLVATDAVRDTANADDLVAAVRGRTGIELQLVDGEREAQLAYRGAAVGEDACGCATWEAATPRRFAPKKDAVCFAEI